ncbi:TadE family type IV pilus minor pilin [Leekyejoonella antrihumi]|uniref:TadE family type IV pilus minor pilin n=1 Tax=Leekyejoonella antrihumi TaxID=1660198 RepID=UPI001644C57A|nr:TadE family type IV pilus minor pilin [Leekyejoonella antrihumi]
MVTAELAATLPAVVFVLAVLLNAVVLGIDQVRCVDAARAAARSAARGDSAGQVQVIGARAAPDGATLEVSDSGGSVTVRVSSPVPGPFGWLAGGHHLGADVTAAREQP